MTTSNSYKGISEAIEASKNFNCYAVLINRASREVYVTEIPSLCELPSTRDSIIGMNDNRYASRLTENEVLEMISEAEFTM